MSETFAKILRLTEEGSVLISEHGYNELVADEIFTRDVFAGVSEGIVVEEYPDYWKGPCVLVLQRDTLNKPIHVLWGISKGKSSPAVLIKAYRPRIKKWSDDFSRRLR
jgi:hypothetical protein